MSECLTGVAQQPGGPVFELRTRLGLTRAQFAALLTLSYDAVWNAECGRFPYIQRKLRERLSAKGYDLDRIDREYADWIQSRAEDVQASIGASHRVEGAVPDFSERAPGCQSVDGSETLSHAG